MGVCYWHKKYILYKCIGDCRKVTALIILHIEVSRGFKASEMLFGLAGLAYGRYRIVEIWESVEKSRLVHLRSDSSGNLNLGISLFSKQQTQFSCGQKKFPDSQNSAAYYNLEIGNSLRERRAMGSDGMRSRKVGSSCLYLYMYIRWNKVIR